MQFQEVQENVEPMTLYANLDFIANGKLSVAYRGSAKPQKLTIREVWPERCIVPNPHLSVIEYALEMGMGGGADFSPLEASVKRINEPKDWEAKKQRWELEVTGLSPLWLHQFVVSHASPIQPLESLEILGSHRLDDSPLSLSDSHVRDWLNHPTTFPGMWGESFFEVEMDEIPKGAAITLALEGATSAPLQEKFHEFVECWSSVTGTFPTSSGKKLRNTDEKQLESPQLSRSKSKLTARWSYFDIAFEPGYNVLVNGLSWFHHNVAKIRKAEIKL